MSEGMQGECDLADGMLAGRSVLRKAGQGP